VNLVMAPLAASRQAQAVRDLTGIVGEVRRLGALADAESISWDRILAALLVRGRQIFPFGNNYSPVTAARITWRPATLRGA
jgi:hypothetical protein